MSEQNIYKDHYELQAAFANAQMSLQNIYGALIPFVAPQGVQLTLQEVIDLVTDILAQKTQTESDSAVAAEVECAVKAEEEDPVDATPTEKPLRGKK